MNKILVFVIILSFKLAFINNLQAQQAYWIFFTDKNNVDFNPIEYFDAKAIERRIKNNVPLNHKSDWPLNKAYVSETTDIVDSVYGQTRWFNGMAVIATDEQKKVLKSLDFIKSIEPMNYKLQIAKAKESNFYAEYEHVRNRQLDVMGFKEFKDKGINGKGVRIAILDGGFKGVNSSPAFEHIRNDNRIIETWDFTKDRGFVFYSITHGTMVMSNIGGQVIDNKDTLTYGLATESEFLLAKTEINREPFAEEIYWLMAAEWADKHGADIINSSLGYTKDRYFKSDMDGKTSYVSRAANMAASKGILVVNAAGNDGGSGWHVLGTPADADSVLTVGGIDPNSENHISFSSYGPTADGRMKPNVCAFGNTMAYGDYMVEENVNGTSFASPLVAGFAACALQANPNTKNMDLFHLIEKSAHLYPYFDYAHGYGVPNAKGVLKSSSKIQEPTFAVDYNGDFVTIKILSSEDHFVGSQHLLYFNIEDSNGVLKVYKVLSVNSLEFKIDLEDVTCYNNLVAMNFHYKAYTIKINL